MKATKLIELLLQKVKEFGDYEVIYVDHSENKVTTIFPNSAAVLLDGNGGKIMLSERLNKTQVNEHST